MPKTIRNPLREGLPSKIYLLAYNDPISGYEIAQKVQNLKHGKTPQTAKIYEWRKKMKAENILIKTEEGYISNAEAILPQINEFLADKEIPISDVELHILLKYIDSKNFRLHVEESYFYEKNFFEGSIDSVRYIAGILGGLTLEEYLLRNDDEDDKIPDFASKKEFDDYWDESIIPQINYNDTTIKEILETRQIEEEYFKKYNRFIKGGKYEELEKSRFIARDGKKIKHWLGDPEYVMFLPSALIKKLCRLSPTYDLFQRASSDELLTLWLRKKEKEGERPKS